VPAETTAVVAAALARHPGLEALDTPAALAAVSPVEGTRRGTAVQLWPHRHGTDAMFVQLLTRDAGSRRR
jgi:16S rRNA (cytosine967-C5)-methyltransferase